MAKTQTFGDKSKKKAADDYVSVKVIKWYNDENRGTLRASEKLVKVKDVNELATIEL
jgi:predicted nucleotide-binding protein (sugar kinase/HSP70/actin superfamily)